MKTTPCPQSVAHSDHMVHGMGWCLASGRHCFHAQMQKCAEKSPPTTIADDTREQMHWLLRKCVVHPNGQTLGEAIMDGLDPEDDDEIAGTIYQAFDKLADAVLSASISAKRARMEAVEGWQDIASAPKDGKQRIDLGGFLTNGKFHRAPDCYWHKKMNRWVSKWSDVYGYSALRLPFEPTHWIKPPSPPESPAS